MLDVGPHYGRQYVSHPNCCAIAPASCSSPRATRRTCSRRSGATSRRSPRDRRTSRPARRSRSTDGSSSARSWSPRIRQGRAAEIDSGLSCGRPALRGKGQDRERETGRSVQLVADHAHQDARAGREGRCRSRARRGRTGRTGWTDAGRRRRPGRGKRCRDPCLRCQATAAIRGCLRRLSWSSLLLPVAARRIAAGVSLTGGWRGPSLLMSITTAPVVAQALGPGCPSPRSGPACPRRGSPAILPKRQGGTASLLDVVPAAAIRPSTCPVWRRRLNPARCAEGRHSEERARVGNAKRAVASSSCPAGRASYPRARRERRWRSRLRRSG